MHAYPVITSLEQFEGEVIPLLDGFGRYERETPEGQPIIIFNYIIPKFPDYDDPLLPWYLEMRGITFCAETGNLVSRPFHKFFNVNERPETLISMLPWDEFFIVKEKADGSMIHVYRLNDEIVFSTRMGPLSDVAIEAARVANLPENKLFLTDIKHELHKSSIELKTLLFEFCSTTNRVVINHNEPSFVYLNLRFLKTGKYLVSENRYSNYFSNCNLVKNPLLLDSENFNITETKEKENTEGVVVIWHQGMVKIKTDWYCKRHNITRAFNSPKEMMNTVINNTVDDVIASFPEDSRTIALQKLQLDLHEWKKRKKSEIESEFHQAHQPDSIERKTFALSIKDSKNKKFLFCLYDGEDINTLIENHILKSKVEIYEELT